ncbi:hypothetical protein DKM44_13900 [Deinococcus irradiatisoli]|uniref:Uncharacterized protein n=1 Tax=Deinococcus irradiatisoli TaxID=2202254 RepID=A0A2Z3JSE0_9DEIO|nr:hypothetical protein [Deinococcus irradiatisoli]AWN24188.1 hypothetical protein DKM44_13900 [Deinococcus irradiatisoli]
MNRGSLLNPAGFLATQDLKDRGWTPRLIAEFLGEHDQTRPNGLKMGRRRLPPVKLYAEARVEEAEREEKFLLAQHRAMQARERAERARATRAQQRAVLLDAAAERYRPEVVPEVLRKGAVRKARAPYLEGLEQLLNEIKRGFAAEKRGALSETEEKELRAALQRRLDAALANVYPWFPSPQVQVEAQGQARPSDWRQWDWDSPERA